mgnify:CR=1 FL=1
MAERNVDTIIFNTEEAVKSSNYIEEKSAPIFKLVPETDPILKEVMPEFDFKNPIVDPNEFASTMLSIWLTNWTRKSSRAKRAI